MPRSKYARDGIQEVIVVLLIIIIILLGILGGIYISRETTVASTVAPAVTDITLLTSYQCDPVECTGTLLIEQWDGVLNEGDATATHPVSGDVLRINGQASGSGIQLHAYNPVTSHHAVVEPVGGNHW